MPSVDGASSASSGTKSGSGSDAESASSADAELDIARAEEGESGQKGDEVGTKQEDGEDSSQEKISLSALKRSGSKRQSKKASAAEGNNLAKTSEKKSEQTTTKQKSKSSSARKKTRKSLAAQSSSDGEGEVETDPFLSQVRSSCVFLREQIAAMEAAVAKGPQASHVVEEKRAEKRRSRLPTMAALSAAGSSAAENLTKLTPGTLRREKKLRKELQSASDAVRMIEDNVETELINKSGKVAAAVVELVEYISARLEALPADEKVPLRVEVIGDAVSKVRTDVTFFITCCEQYLGNMLDALHRARVAGAAGRVKKTLDDLESAATEPVGTFDANTLGSVVTLVADAKHALEALRRGAQALSVQGTADPDERLQLLRGALQESVTQVCSQCQEKVRSRLEAATVALFEAISDSVNNANRRNAWSNFNSVARVFDIALQHVLLACGSDVSWSEFSALVAESAERQTQVVYQHAAGAIFAMLETQLEGFADAWNGTENAKQMAILEAATACLARKLQTLQFTASDSHIERALPSTARSVHNKLAVGDSFDLRGRARLEGKADSASGAPAVPSSALPVRSNLREQRARNKSALQEASDDEGSDMDGDFSASGRARSLSKQNRLARYTMNQRMLETLLRSRFAELERPGASFYATPTSRVAESRAQTKAAELPRALLESAEEVESIATRVMTRLQAAVRHQMRLLRAQIAALIPSRTSDNSRHEKTHASPTATDHSELLFSDKTSIIQAVDEVLRLASQFSFAANDSGSVPQSEPTSRKLVGGRERLISTAGTHTNLAASRQGLHGRGIHAAEIQHFASATRGVRQQHTMLKILETSRTKLKSNLAPAAVSNAVVSSFTDPVHLVTDMQNKGARTHVASLLLDRINAANAIFRASLAQIVTNMRWLSFAAAKSASGNISEKQTHQAFAVILQIGLAARNAGMVATQLLDCYETLAYLCDMKAVSSHSRELATKNRDSKSVAHCCLDINIWEETRAGRHKVKTDAETGVVSAADLNVLVSYLAPCTGFRFASDPTFVAFITTFRTMHVSPHALFDKIVERANGPVGSNAGKISDDLVEHAKLSSVTLLEHWFESAFSDFDSLLVHRVCEFLSALRYSSQDPELCSATERTLAMFEDRASALHAREETILTISEFPEPTSPPVSVSKLFFQYSAQEIARQLTVVDFEVYSHIKPSELLDQAWNVSKKEHLAPNVSSMLQRANTGSYWVASVILMHRDVNLRSQALTKIIHVAEHLAKLQNMNGLMAIIAGLHVSSISRLKQTWALVDFATQGLIQEYLKIFDPSASYKNYRAHVSGASPPLIPYIGISLTDLTFADEGNADSSGKDKHGHTKFNMSKRATTAKIINSLLSFQKTPYKIPAVEPLRTYMSALQGADDKELYELSLKIEPRDNS